MDGDKAEVHEVTKNTSDRSKTESGGIDIKLPSRSRGLPAQERARGDEKDGSFSSMVGKWDSGSPKMPGGRGG